MTKLGRFAWGLALLVLCWGLAPGRAAAQNSDPGEEAEGFTAPVIGGKAERKSNELVRAKFFEKAHRWEFFPHVYASVLNNSYANRFLVLSGVGVSYHFREALFLEGVVDLFPFFPSSFYDDLKSLPREIAYEVGEIPVVPRESVVVGAAIGFSPIYGKINLVSSHVQNFDISFVGGLALLRIQAAEYMVSGIDEQTGWPTIAGPLESSVTESFLSPNLGMSMRFFLNHSLTLRADARGYGYLDTDVLDYANPYVENGVTKYPFKTVFRNSFILAVGFSGFLPLGK